MPTLPNGARTNPAPAAPVRRPAGMKPDDAALLRKFAATRDPAAFAELVRRHVDLVYSSALRRCSGDSHHAQDVVQQVFIALARHAGRLAEHPALAAWLFAATRNAAIKLLVAEQSRRRRETAAMNEGRLEPAGMEPPVDWSLVAPVLERALDELNDADRAAVVLRYFEQRTFGEIAAALSMKENAARMRTERALEKLRERLAARGIKSAGAALGVALARHAIGAAPAGLAAGTTDLALGAIATAGTVSAFAMLWQWLRAVVASGWTWTAVVALTTLAAGGWIWRSTAPIARENHESGAGSVSRSSAARPRTGPFEAPPVPDRVVAAAARRPPVSERSKGLLHPGATKVGRRNLTPSENLLRASCEAYARLHTYQDEGEVVVVGDAAPEKGVVSFVTRYEQPKRLFVSWSRQAYSRNERSAAGRFWSDGKEARYELVDSGWIPVTLDPARGFEVMSEESAVMTNRVPALLVSPEDGWDLEPYERVLPLSDEAFDGVNCYRVSVRFRDRTRTELLWIGKEDLLVRRIFRIWDPGSARGVGLSPAAGRVFVNEVRRNLRVNEPLPPGTMRSSMRD